MQPPAVNLIFPDGGGEEADSVWNPCSEIGFAGLYWLRFPHWKASLTSPGTPTFWIGKFPGT